MIDLLLVEDSGSQAAQVILSFQEMDRDIRITSVTTGADCLKEVAKIRYSAILLDYFLPDMNGLEILTKIREQESPPPVIMVTGEGDTRVAVEAMKAGAADYVIKSPGYPEVLPAVVRQVLEGEGRRFRLAAAEERLRGMHEVSLVISLELSPERLARRLAEGIRRLSGSETAVVLFFKSNFDEAEVVAREGVDLALPIDPGLFATGRGPLLVAAGSGKDGPAALLQGYPGVRSALLVPLVKGERRLGGMLVCNPTGGRTYGAEDQEIVFNLALHAATALENAHYVRRIETLAVTDGLTGFYNHREFQKRLEEEIQRARRYHRPLSLLMIDIDHFKSFNDAYGHPFGDAVLKKVGALILSGIRGVDFAARYGGEEFALIIPETSAEGAFVVAERIRSRIFDEVFETDTDVRTQVTVSIGLADLTDGHDRVALLACADRALYAAKAAGRNRVCRYANAPEVDSNALFQSNLQTCLDRDCLFKDLAAAADAKSPYTRGQSEEVARLAVDLGRALRLSPEAISGLRQAGLLHNVGTFHIPGRILNKKASLTEEETKVIRAHPLLAERILKQSLHLDVIVPAILYHHERYDGKGYPSGLEGEEIPFVARVLAVTSAYQAMTSPRPYRKKMSSQEARAELRRIAGSQFDPRIVETFILMLEEREKK